MAQSILFGKILPDRRFFEQKEAKGAKAERQLMKITRSPKDPKFLHIRNSFGSLGLGVRKKQWSGFALFASFCSKNYVLPAFRSFLT
ncbi:hypothetical protein [Cerasicoccus fimbriatus]|uniref:hypothetical protein n=1 Tax=Cerasicoccus fimbriatus TaxID=3014554 RepID=UPI0022B31328|nr:hypothetical protein [Cerasicoccus sp. TK19100]